MRGGPSGPGLGDGLLPSPLAGSAACASAVTPLCQPVFRWVSRLPPVHPSVFVESGNQPWLYARVTCTGHAPAK